MSQYCIGWRNRENGRSGQSTKVWEQADAQQLAQELNEEYPNIEHWVEYKIPKSEDRNPNPVPGEQHAV